MRKKILPILLKSYSLKWHPWVDSGQSQVVPLFVQPETVLTEYSPVPSHVWLFHFILLKVIEGFRIVQRPCYQHRN